jgi:GNAT superfamily N-acetyltransferase
LFVRRYGWVTLVKDWFSKINHWHNILSDRVVVTERSLTGTLPIIKFGIPLVVRRAREEDLDELRRLAEKYSYWRLYDFFMWLRRKDAFFLAISDGSIVGYAAAGRRDSFLFGFVRLREDDAVGLGVFVLPEYRGYRVSPALVSAYSRYLVKQGFRRVVSWIEFGNCSARRAHMRVGVTERITSVSVLRACLIGITDSVRCGIFKDTSRS